MRLLRTVSYYRPRQIWWRLWKKLTEPVQRRMAARLMRKIPRELRGSHLLVGSPVSRLSGVNLINGRWILQLPGECLELPYPLDWLETEKAITTRLGRFCYHYHEYLLRSLLSDSEQEPASLGPRFVWEAIQRWIEAYPSPTNGRAKDAWHPYVVSRRIPVWVGLLARRELKEGEADRILESLVAQARWLRENLEFDLGGNHLLQNLRALIVAGGLFAGKEADQWLRLGERLLRKELARQILPHGEHFERSPSYHVDMMVALLDIAETLRQVGLDGERRVFSAVDTMADFLENILHPDGEIPLFGDSAFGLAPKPAEVFQRLGRSFPSFASTEERAQVVGQYWLYRFKDRYLIFDAGPVGPDHLPAHAHADLLTLEASWAGKRLFVDSGVFDYEESQDRLFCRSTAAHNTLELDGQNQCDVWSRFRMGHRGWPGVLAHGRQGPFLWAYCTHNAYRFCKVPTVARLVACSALHGWLVVDWACGVACHQMVSRLRIGPGWQARLVEGRTVEVSFKNCRLLIQPITPEAELRLKPSAYFPQFGRREEIVEVVQKHEKNLPAFIGWYVNSSEITPVTHLLEEGRLVVSDGQNRWVFPIKAGSYEYT